MELRARLTAVNRRVSPDPSGPNAFFMFTQAKAWYVFGARHTARRVLQFGYLVQCPKGLQDSCSPFGAKARPQRTTLNTYKAWVSLKSGCDPEGAGENGHPNL
jgi:hypothetical protein